MNWKKQIQNLKAYQPGKTIDDVKKLYGLSSIVKLSSNENPFGFSAKVEEYLRKAEFTYSIYPDGYAKILRNSLSSHLGVSEKQVILGNGSDEIIQIITRGLLQQGANTVMASPTFPQYKHNAVIEGAEVREIVLDEYGRHNLDEMLKAIDENTTVVWLCSPNNPSGEYISEKSLTNFLDRVPPHVLTVLDEAYFEYVTAGDYYDAIKLVEKYPRLLVTRTFSKAYGLAGLRVGYGIANEEIISKLEPLREPFNNNIVAQGAAAAALTDQEFIERCRLENRKGMEQYYELCREKELKYFPSQANFIVIDFGIDGDEVFQHLLSKGYIVRSGKALGFPTAVRITIGTPEQNQGLLETIRDFLNTDD
ncbi:histidinol-phosphate transaminase [Rossellomorea vietnamensis]|uniref:Histidinol-phosphate aminotransferase n=1 Tax=Rossellomorea vietnamensis TaxID=218284 RepID=A0A5D4NX52_9BACI|nr:histidinol-phosphate transaminase [Rossellomorea vietnamensis]TYS18935.1 histidinol-phosphate transaminase [Rossellomorea vietnamensis]